MEDSVKGTVISVIKLWGLKINADIPFPHLVTVQYKVNKTTYKKSTSAGNTHASLKVFD